MSVQEVSYDHAIELANAERYDEALVILDQLSLAQPQVVDFDCLRARLHYDRGDAQAAFAVLDAALAKLPGLALHPAHRWSSRGVIAHRYGMLLMGMERLQEALPWLEEAALRNGLSSGEWSARLHAGLVRYRLGDYAAAGAYWYDLLYRAPDLGAADILGQALAYVHAAGEQAEPMLRLCLARIGLDNPELLELDEAAGDAFAAEQAGIVLASQPDHPQARRIRAPLRYRAGDLDGAWDDLATYQRQVPDPKAQVRELEWRHQAGEAEPWLRFAFAEGATDATGYYHAGVALAEFMAAVPAAEAALAPQLIKGYRLGLARFEKYFATGEGGYDDADPHLYSLLCHNLAQRLEGADLRAERIALREKGIAASEFIEHWIDLLACLEAAGQHPKAVEVAGDVLNRYPLERDPSNVGWVFSRLMSTWKAIGGAEVMSAARDALAHVDARADALPVEERSQTAHALAHARAHFAGLLRNAAGGMDQHDRTDALAEIEVLQRRALLIEDAWLCNEFGLIWRDLGAPERALPLFEQAIALTAGDPWDQAFPRVQRALIRNGEKQYAEALTDFQTAFAARDRWEGDAYLGAVEAALGLEQRETALAYFDKARAQGAAQGKTRTLFTRVEASLRATRPAWKFWGV
ncbi:tetratricopeptide repeat protein [Cupriavidus basilensis]|uniref:Tetratricopeptide repeat protein n=1 Tax=Cupriavidus basilensis TaxID=68895 RepID=A0ABT6AS70_9BURK|nr:tetratricopeptide repeat protein [Cupriavidus basilensis]MDF3835477.1 tetratricopeptide repeat protein [Cupriavidus basilensis]